MKIETHITQRIVRNVLISLLIYALPIVLMLFTFYFTGQRPWQKTSKVTTEKSITEKKLINP